MPLIYLSGPICGLTYDEASDWREQARGMFLPHIKGLSPLRGKEYLRDEGALTNRPYDVKPLSTAAGITTRDRWDTTRADAMLLNLIGASEVSIGSMIEVGWADAARVPIVLAIDEQIGGKYPNKHYGHAILFNVAGYIVPTLEAACGVINALFSQDV